MDWRIVQELNDIMPYAEVYRFLAKWSHPPDNSRYKEGSFLHKKAIA